MKMIDVLSLLAKGEIEENTKLIVSDDFEEFEYKYRKIYRSFVDEDLDELDERFNIDEDFLNWEVRLEQPTKKYYIKLPYSEFYVCLVKTKDNEKEIIPYPKDNMMFSAFIQSATEDGFKAEFTEKDFDEIEELQPYKPFKELVKDDENE